MSLVARFRMIRHLARLLGGLERTSRRLEVWLLLSAPDQHSLSLHRHSRCNGVCQRRADELPAAQEEKSSACLLPFFARHSPCG